MSRVRGILSPLVGRTCLRAVPILMLGLGVTAWAWTMARDKELADLRLRFQRQVIRASTEVEDHLRNCEAIAKGARGLFAASEDVTADEWNTYIAAADIPQYSPALGGVGFVERVPEDEVDEFLLRAQLENPRFAVPDPRPDSIDPDSTADEARIIRLIEPIDSNRTALGVDLRTRPGVAATMNRARDTGNTAMSPVIQLTQDETPQPSVVVYLPIYDKGADVSTIERRRAALRGWICAPVRLRELARNMLDSNVSRHIDMEFVEHRADGPPAVVLDTDGVIHPTSGRHLREVVEVNFGGQRWDVRFTGLPGFGAGEAEGLATLTGASGTALSFLLFGVVLSLTRTRTLAEQLARAMTASLRESEARYEAAVSATRQLLYDWNPDTGVITLRGSAREALGLALPNPTTLDEWISLVHPDDREAFRHEIERVLRTTAPFSLEYRLQRLDGAYAIVHDSGCFFRDSSGRISRMVGFVIDITERRRAEEERRQSDERFRVLFERSGVPFLLLAEGRVIDCNDAATRMLGIPAKSGLVGLKPHEFSPEVQPDGQASRSRMDELLAEVEEKGAATFEWTCRRANGDTFIVEAIHASVVLGGGAKAVLVGWHDLTQQRRAEQERRRLQRVLQIAVDAMPQRVFWKDRSGAFLGCNRAFARDAGVSDAEEIVGKTDFDLAWRAHAHTRRADDFEIMAAGRPRVNVEERAMAAGGVERWLRSTKVPLYDESGRTIGILGTFEDITDERAAKDELRRARDTAEAASRAKSDFLANMSHEIRTPMTAILGYADLLADPDQQSADRLGCVKTIRRNGEHLLAIINDILDLSKIEAGKMSVERVPVNPAAIVRDAVSLLAPRAESKGLHHHATFGTLVPRAIVSDPTRLRQMLLNLVGNAVKFTERGSIELRFGYEPPHGDSPGRVRFDVTDTGIGMPEDVIARLFQPFTQGDTSTTRRFGGTGLGLTVTRRLASLLGGDVSVTSLPGAGSTFTLHLPLGSAEPPELIDPREDAPDAGEAAAPTATRLSGRILLVEDGPDNQRLIAHLLRGAGAEVEIAANGQVALDRVAAAPLDQPPFDIVLMDMQMPVLDGYSATLALRARGFRAPIISLTAHAMAGERERCIAAGCDDYATKPVTRESLLALCARWLAAAHDPARGTPCAPAPPP